jgi:cytochrome c oxidase subunit 3
MSSTTSARPHEEARRDSRPDALRGKPSEPHEGRRVSTLPHAVMVLPSETGIWVAVAAISMSFAALISAMIVRQGIAPDWLHFQLPRILYFNTLILIASSLTLETSRRGFAADADFRQQELRNEQTAARALPWLYITMALGLLFVLGQVIAWRDLAARGLFLASSPSSSFFYVLTALHGVHVLGGIVGLAYVFWRLRRSPGPRQTGALGVASVYWHFMDGLWVFLLVVLTART